MANLEFGHHLSGLGGSRLVESKARSVQAMSRISVANRNAAIGEPRPRRRAGPSLPAAASRQTRANDKRATVHRSAYWLGAVPVVVWLSACSTLETGAPRQSGAGDTSELAAAARAPDRPELLLRPSDLYDYDVPVAGSYSLPVLMPAAGGTVVDTEGKPLNLGTLVKGRITLLSFIYTRCGDSAACPHATSVLYDIHTVSAKDAAIARGLQLLTMSFDPEYDTPKVLAEYSAALRQAKGSTWRFLTTTGQKELAPILKAYGQTVDRKRDPNDPLGPYNHVLRVYLIDGGGQVRNIYSSGLLDPRLVVTDVRTLLLEESQTAEVAR